MPKKNFTDAITFTQPVMKEISDVKAKEALQDPNLKVILSILRETNLPMTVADIEEAFKKIDKEKSSKTIYRYLKKLEKTGLVVQAGKRVFSDLTEKLRTQTLYQRSARLHFPIKTPLEIKKQKEDIFCVIRKMLEILFDKKITSADDLDNLLADMFVRESELIRKLLHNMNEKQVEFMADWNFKQLQTTISIIGRLVLFYDDDLWNQRLKACFVE